MKKILLFIIGLFVLPICVSAEKYRISDLDLSIDVPDSYLVITRDNYKNNPEMDAYGVTPEYMEQVFTTYNAYLDAFDISTGKEIFIIVNPVNGDYSNYSKDVLEDLIPALESQYISLGATNIKIDIVNINGMNYFQVDYSQGGYYLVNYYLVYQNNGYNFQIQSSSILTDSDKNAYYNIVKTITFGEEEEDVPPTVDNEEPKQENNTNNKEDSEDNSNLFIIIGASAGVLLGVIIGLVVSANKKKNNKCKNCGVELNKDIMFCPNCGTKK